MKLMKLLTMAVVLALSAVLAPVSAMAMNTLERTSVFDGVNTFKPALRVCLEGACTVQSPGSIIALDQKRAVAWAEATYGVDFVAKLSPQGGRPGLNRNGVVDADEGHGGAGW